jgi:hypothetical protein
MRHLLRLITQLSAKDMRNRVAFLRLGWMPSCQYPIASHLQGIRIIAEVQGYDGGASHSGASNDPQAIFTPAEVGKPILCPGVEKRNSFSGFRINSQNAVAFIAITQGTSEPEIRFRVGAPFGKGNNMFNFQTSHNQMLRTEAVTATVLCRCSHTALDFHGDVITCHWVS